MSPNGTTLDAEPHIVFVALTSLSVDWVSATTASIELVRATLCRGCLLSRTGCTDYVCGILRGEALFTVIS
jgi:hypothetical protein